MNNIIQDKPPILLLPDRPALLHQLSYSTYQQNQKFGQVFQMRQQSILADNKKLEQLILKKKSQILEQKQNQFLLQTQILRLREIIRTYDKKNRNLQEQYQNLQGLYRLQLQKLKIELNKKFEQQLKQERHNIIKQFQKLQKLHQQKRNIIKNEKRNQQQNSKYNILEIDEKNRKIQVMKIRIDQDDKKILTINRINNQLEIEISKIKLEKDFIQNKLKNVLEQNVQQQNIINSRQKQLQSENLEYYEQICKLKKNNDEKYTHLLNIQEELKEKKEQIQNLKFKYSQLQNQLNTFKNRKTQSMHPQEGKKNQKTNKKQQRGVQNWQGIIQTNQVNIQTQFIQFQNHQDNQENKVNTKIGNLQGQLNQMTKLLQEKNEQIAQLNQNLGKTSKILNERIVKMQNLVNNSMTEWQLYDKNLTQVCKSVETVYLNKIEELSVQLSGKEQELKMMTDLCQKMAMKDTKPSNSKDKKAKS